MNVLEKAIEVYGADLQKQVAIEEMSELIKEICKDFRGKGNKHFIIEEIADVQIMLQQLLIIYGISTAELSIATKLKLDRLEKRLANEDN